MYITATHLQYATDEQKCKLMVGIIKGNIQYIDKAIFCTSCGTIHRYEDIESLKAKQTAGINEVFCCTRCGNMWQLIAQPKRFKVKVCLRCRT